jgi:hypothetical protein
MFGGQGPYKDCRATDDDDDDDDIFVCVKLSSNTALIGEVYLHTPSKVNEVAVQHDEI